MFASRQLEKNEVSAYGIVSPELAKRVRVITIPTFIKGFKAITLGRFIFIKGDHSCDGDDRNIAHELVHVRQWSELGVVGFLVNYLGDWFRGLVKHSNLKQAYLHINLEIEARQIEDKWATDHC